MRSFRFVASALIATLLAPLAADAQITQQQTGGTTVQQAPTTSNLQQVQDTPLQLQTAWGQAALQGKPEAEFGNVRPTPKVIAAVSLTGGMGQRVRDGLSKPRISRTPIKVLAPAKRLGPNGAQYNADNTIFIESEGRRTRAGLYRKDMLSLEEHLATRGLTQKAREASRSNANALGQPKNAKRRLPRTANSGKAAANGNELTPATEAVSTSAPSTSHAGALQLATLNAAMWERAPSTTLEGYTSDHGKKESRSAQPAPPPADDMTEKDRGPFTFSYEKPVGGDISLTIQTTSGASAGATRRHAASQQKGHLNAFDLLKLDLYDVLAELSSSRVHTGQGNVNSGGSVAGRGGTKVLGVWLKPGMPQSVTLSSPSWKWSSGADWILSDKQSFSILIPVGMFEVSISYGFGYSVGSKAELVSNAKGLEARAITSPVLGFFLELTAGIGFGAFSVGVGGHLNIIGSSNGKDAGSAPLNVVSTYTADFNKHSIRSELIGDLYGLSGHLFVFIDTFWERYDFDLFSWRGVDLLGDNKGSIRSLEYDIYKTYIYQLVALRRWECTNDVGRLESFHIWDGVAPTSLWAGAKAVTQPCKGQPVDKGIVGHVAMNQGPDTRAAVLCHVQPSVNAWEADYWATAIASPRVIGEYGTLADFTTLAQQQCASAKGKSMGQYLFDRSLGYVFQQESGPVRVKGPGTRPERDVNLMAARVCRENGDLTLRIGANVKCSGDDVYNGTFGIVPP